MAKIKSAVILAVKKTLPAIVSIVMEKETSQAEQGLDVFNSNLEQGKKMKSGGGSGFIVGKNGIVLTNRHILEDKKAGFTVVLQSGEKCKPEILALDKIRDVAVLKIEKNNLPIIKLGNSDKLELGQEVIAIGNVLGIFQNTVSRGVVSGLSREIKAKSGISEDQTKLKGLIQTDAAINPGNSGGPLIDLTGKAVGVNAAMVFGAENIGFALPINNGKIILNDLKKYGRIRLPFLGVRYLQIDKNLQRELKLKTDFGALITTEDGILSKKAVMEKSPAEKAGLKQNDIILEINNKQINQDNTLSDVLQELKISQTIALKILRDNEKKSIQLQIEEKN